MLGSSIRGSGRVLFLPLTQHWGGGGGVRAPNAPNATGAHILSNRGPSFCSCSCLDLPDLSLQPSDALWPPPTGPAGSPPPTCFQLGPRQSPQFYCVKKLYVLLQIHDLNSISYGQPFPPQESPEQIISPPTLCSNLSSSLRTPINLLFGLPLGLIQGHPTFLPPVFLPFPQCSCLLYTPHYCPLPPPLSNQHSVISFLVGSVLNSD